MRSNEKLSKAFKLSVTAAVLIIVNALLLGAAATWFPQIIPTIPGTEGNSVVPFTSLTAAGLVFGVIVLLGALMLRSKPANKKLWGILIIAFSAPSVIMGGGFIIGFIIGIAGGALAFKN